jgi:hypothetical protein
MSDSIPQSAYDAAAAVFSRSFRFVEWKFIATNDTARYPFGDHGQSIDTAIVPIDREKWIYVFMHHANEEYAAIREEIRIDANGEMAATPWDKIEKPLKERGKPEAIGKSLCLPRRIFGTPEVYRFYASRVRLPLKQIKELERNIYKFAPATSLEPGKNTTVVEKDGNLLVPVVDPITVLLHLHAAYEASVDDVIHYTVAHDGLPDATKRAVLRRHKKHLLATVIKGIIGDEKNTEANNLVQLLEGMQSPVEEFITHYERSVAWRIERKVRLGANLVKWLQSDAIRIAGDAYRGSPRLAWPTFLVPWCHCITRLNESPAGRLYVLGLLDDKSHFVHTYVWPKEDLPTDDIVQSVRKGGLTLLEGWKTIAEARILQKSGDYVEETLATLKRLRRARVELLDIKLSREAIKTIVAEKRRINETIKGINARTIADVPSDINHFARGARSIGAIIEGVNLCFAVAAVMEAMKGTDPEQQKLAIIGLIGSGLDASSAIVSLLKNTEHVVVVLGFVSGVIDIYLGHVAMDKAFKDGEKDVAAGAFLTAAGATIGVSGICMGLLAIPGAQIVGIIGLAVVAIGSAIKALYSQTPLERFFDRCSWGKHHLESGGADWSPTRFEQWKGDKEFDYQLEALLNIICKIEVDKDDLFSHRTVTLKAGWIPPDAKLEVTYAESWTTPNERRVLQATVTFPDTGPVSNNAGLPARAAGKTGVTLTDQDGVNGRSRAGGAVPRPLLTPQWLAGVNMTLPNPQLARVAVTARLAVAFAGGVGFTIPHNASETELYSK